MVSLVQGKEGRKAPWSLPAGIVILNEVKNLGANPCAPLRGRGPRSGAGVYYTENFK